MPIAGWYRHIASASDIAHQVERLELVTEDLFEEVFGLTCRVIDDPVAGCPLVIPLGTATLP